MDKQEEHKKFLSQGLKQIEGVLAIKQLQLNSLLEITRAVNNNYPAEALYRIYEFVLRTQMGVQQLAMFSFNSNTNNWNLDCFFGKEEALEEKEVLSILHGINDIEQLEADSPLKLMGFEIVIPVLHKEQPIAYSLLGKMNADNSDTVEEKLKFIQTITNVVSVAIENKRLFSQHVEQEVLKKELELAAKMQSMLIPSSLPNNDRIQAAAFYLPHRDIGGDYYDYLEISENEMVFCISDISGKGVAAGLLMSNFQANLRTLINKEYPLEQLVDLLNFKVGEITKGEKFITFFIGHYHFETRKLRYINAGHNPSILVNGSELKELKSGCTLLGMFDHLPFVNMGEEFLEPGAVVLNYTDGLTDLENAKAELFEEERVLAFTKENAHLDMKAFVEKLLKTIDDFRGEVMYNDDVSILAIKLP